MRVRFAAAFAVIVLSLLFNIGCGDTFRPVALPIIQPGGQPQTLRHAVVVSDAGPSVDGATTHIDVSGDTNVGQVTVGRDPVHAALVNSGAITVVANSGSNTLNFYSTTQPLLATPPATVTLQGSSPTYVYSNVVNKVFVALSGSGTVGAVNFSGTPSEILPELATGSNPVALVGSPDGTKLYVANKGSDNVSVIDTAGPTKITDIGVGSSPSFLVISPDGKLVYSVNSGSNSVSVIDTSTNVVTTTVAVGASPNYATFDVHNSRVWVTNSGGNTVSAINSDLSVSTVSLASSCTTPAPKSITVLADGTRAYVADSGCASVSVINALSNTVTKTIVVGATPVSIASSGDSSKVIVVSSGANAVSDIRTSDDTVSATLNVPAKPVFLTITP